MANVKLGSYDGSTSLPTFLAKFDRQATVFAIRTAGG